MSYRSDGGRQAEAAFLRCLETVRVRVTESRCQQHVVRKGNIRGSRVGLGEPVPIEFELFKHICCLSGDTCPQRRTPVGLWVEK